MYDHAAPKTNGGRVVVVYLCLSNAGCLENLRSKLSVFL